MYRKLLTKQFFREHPYMGSSVQRFVYSTLSYKNLEQVATEISLDRMGLGDDRLEQIGHEKEMILAQTDPTIIFELLRKKLDVVTRPALIEKALEHEEQILPTVMEKLIRSTHDTFIRKRRPASGEV